MHLHEDCSVGQKVAQKRTAAHIATTRQTTCCSHVHHAGLTALVLGDLLRHHALPAILVGLRHLLLEVDDGLGRVQALGAAAGAVHDAVAPVELHGVVHPGQALLRELVTGVCDPTVGLHEDGGAEVVLRVPPVGRARGHAAGAEDALVHAVELGAVVLALVVLRVALLLHVLALQPRLDGLVLVVEVREVRHEVLDHVGVGQGLDLNRLVTRLDVQQAGQAVLAVDVHGAGAADALPAGAAEGQGRIVLVLDLDERVQDHGAAGLQVDGVLLQERLCHGVRVVAVDAEGLRRGHLRGGGREGAAAADTCHRGPHVPRDREHGACSGACLSEWLTLERSLKQNSP
mmetsp:Transcript_76177/g.172236  ORF Transcript_76177/g.172236 Transcript_76177/m.172236 type:complete len:345 (-) Transcript_76177:2-1036(-)